MRWRRLMVSVATLAVLGAGFFFVPAGARPASGPTDTLTGGTATIAVGSSNSVTTWTTTLSGQLAAGGRVYKGSASGTSFEDNPYGYASAFAGTSPSGSITASCFGDIVPNRVLGPNTVAPPPPLALPAGVLEETCSVSIDGAPNADVELFLALAPAGPDTYSGVYAAQPDGARVDALPTVPVVSFGLATAGSSYDAFSASLYFGFFGQITLGDQTFHGTASGTSDASQPSSANPPFNVAPFSLTGTSPTGTINATCSGVFESAGPYDTQVITNVGLGLSVLSCDGSVNAGTQGHATLVSVYRVTGHEIHAGERTSYGGAFVGA